MTSNWQALRKTITHSECNNKVPSVGEHSSEVWLKCEHSYEGNVMEQRLSYQTVGAFVCVMQAWPKTCRSMFSQPRNLKGFMLYTGRKIAESLGYVTVKGEKRWKDCQQSVWACIIYIYYSQLSSVAILLQPERNCFTSYNTRKGLCSLSLCAIVLPSPPASDVSTCNGQRSSQLFCV
jgi:hypothetical protein